MRMIEESGEDVSSVSQVATNSLVFQLCASREGIVHFISDLASRSKHNSTFSPAPLKKIHWLELLNTLSKNDSLGRSSPTSFRNCER